MASKGPSRTEVGDPRGGDFVREQQRRWTWYGFECFGVTHVLGGEQVIITEMSSTGASFRMNFAKKHPRAQQCVSAAVSLMRGMRTLSGFDFEARTPGRRAWRA